MKNYDFIGDIHGHYDLLVKLLSALGYQSTQGQWYHPEGRNLFFLGDYIDRGPDGVKVCRLVRDVVEQNMGIALLGNHEYNAIMFHHTMADGQTRRPRNNKNLKQHIAFLNDVLTRKNGPDVWDEMIGFFKTLPFSYETPEFVAAHACFDYQAHNALRDHFGRGTSLEAAWDDIIIGHYEQNIETLCKGPEMTLPCNISYQDKDGHTRRTARRRWWHMGDDKTWSNLVTVSNLDTIRELSDVKDVPVPPRLNLCNSKPRFFGHYWLSPRDDQRMYLLNNYSACLDFSVAKNGILGAYRFNGEQTLDANNLIGIESRSEQVVRGTCQAVTSSG